MNEKRCGHCAYFEPYKESPVIGRCTCKVPIWAVRAVQDDIGLHVVFEDDFGATDCPFFEKEVKE